MKQAKIIDSFTIGGTPAGMSRKTEERRNKAETLTREIVEKGIKRMQEYTKYRGFIIRRVNHPTPISPSRMTWDICDGAGILKSNIGSLEVAKHYINVMIQYGYWQEKC